MSAAAALRAAAAFGVVVRTDGSDLLLEAPAPPPPDVLTDLRRHKAAILAVLRPVRDGWSSTDRWMSWGGRAGIAESATSLLARLEAGETIGDEDAIAALRNSDRFLAAMARHAFRLDLGDAQAEWLAVADLLADWQRANGPEGVEPDLCCGCGEPIDVAGSDWRVFGDGAWTHCGGRWGLRCRQAWRQAREREALAALLREATDSGK